VVIVIVCVEFVVLVELVVVLSIVIWAVERVKGTVGMVEESGISVGISVFSLPSQSFIKSPRN